MYRYMCIYTYIYIYIDVYVRAPESRYSAADFSADDNYLPRPSRLYIIISIIVSIVVIGFAMVVNVNSIITLI